MWCGQGRGLGKTAKENRLAAGGEEIRSASTEHRHADDNGVVDGGAGDGDGGRGGGGDGQEETRIAGVQVIAALDGVGGP